MTNRGQQENTDLITVINFVKQVMATLKKIRRTIENSTGLQSDPAGNVINSSTKNFNKDLWTDIWTLFTQWTPKITDI